MAAMMTQLISHNTSSPHDLDVLGDVFGRNIYLPGLAVIAVLIYSRIDRGLKIKDKLSPV